MNTTTIESFCIVGIAIRTTNENNQAATDIPKLWETFFTEKIAAHISNRIDDAVYCLYTDYESDYAKPYNTIIGCRVPDLDTIPQGMLGRIIQAGNYTVFSTKGKLMSDMVYRKWIDIWNTPLDRAYTTDFEVYGPKTADPENAEVDIYIALK